MSGHSKWSTIKHKKGAADAKRGKIFSRLAKELTVSARLNGGDPAANITLRTILAKCKAANMPSDNIERAIKKGTGDLQGAAIEEILFESYAPGGVGLIIQCLSDNRNRSVADVRHVLQRHNATLAGSNQVLRNFQRRGQILLDAAGVDEDQLIELALDAGADDVTNEGGQFEVLTPPNAYNEVSEKLTAAGYNVSEDSGVNFVPTVWAPVTDKAQAASLLKLVEAIEELEDVQYVYMNGDIADEAIEG
ncbi:MAG: YebC/PmpR family DNA-binding transcriptional regulator [Kiritimatiellae bacterium]|jgi:YebC/PmpR family DNA-binding regulatory protein|nr:YebC/PmpR family DNA-binding transcriptional regulator [Kiritimatiellia bacterium]NLD89224.1 YebC/PmpR family DNA-binding transcriptional regulator [Lentisphaerota bacterium]HPC20592.1 YebC/PmpR family DNA-binding transcriptional regulator [Kiritimatiellia bacterium]HQN80369.1 YebC/PmpR family DNA-binding transcriptional regulator [Kiritimatiellia bacterium]HQQ60579.1 YebC/PmpR family DNA-binding transcriptional regulator [Kiritimatiellia bacterium]